MLNIVKIGGNIIDNEAHLLQCLQDFALIRGQKILVHGGGKLATQLGEQLGVPSQFIEGKRVTNEPMLRIAAMVYAGWVNKHIVALLQANACNALGLSGADANCIPATRRPAEPVDYGFVGDIAAMRLNIDFLQTLLAQNITPVFSAITHDTHGVLLNSNADSIASTVAVAMSRVMQVRLIFCFEKNGILSDVNDDNSCIPEIHSALYEEYKANGTISGGMIPKVDAALKALSAGVNEVVIKHGLYLNSGGGTVIKKQNSEE
ncbi:acetylglutamate kinase [Bacteroidia bacterium]|nr:acetylglutamate kinase [Bacteroidia bacterium]